MCEDGPGLGWCITRFALIHPTAEFTHELRASIVSRFRLMDWSGTFRIPKCSNRPIVNTREGQPDHTE